MCSSDLVRDNSDNQYTLNKEDAELYGTKKAENLTLYEQRNNELEAFNNYLTFDKPAGIREQAPGSYEDMLRHPSYGDFQAANTESVAKRGTGLFAKPYDELLTQRAADENAARVENVKNIATGGAGDDLEKSGAAPVGPALTAEEINRLRDLPSGYSLSRPANNLFGPRNFTPIPPNNMSLIPEKEEQGTFDTMGFDDVGAAIEAEDKALGEAMKAKAAAEAAAVRARAMIPNPLDQFDSYTYGLALHVCDRSEYDRLLENAVEWTPQHTLVASAGRADTNLKRQKGWEDNFYFESFKLTQVIAPNTTTRTTNSIEIEFTLIEPMGLSFKIGRAHV